MVLVGAAIGCMSDKGARKNISARVGSRDVDPTTKSATKRRPKDYVRAARCKRKCLVERIPRGQTEDSAPSLFAAKLTWDFGNIIGKDDGDGEFS